MAYIIIINRKFYHQLLQIFLAVYKYFQRLFNYLILTNFNCHLTIPVFNVPQFIAKLTIPPNYRLHRRWRFNEGALYLLDGIWPLTATVNMSLILNFKYCMTINMCFYGNLPHCTLLW